ncbi:MAG: hypothetical protein LBF17_03580 [Mediterranea sp.]|jgi:hypothetical protein|nr:hypothetical protein [Mediterranea sp.]
MKNIGYILSAICLLLTAGCEKDNVWGDGDPKYEHVYYVGFYKSILFSYYVTYEIAADGSTQWREGSSTSNGTWAALEERNVVGIPFEFHSERVRTYDVVTKFWITTGDGLVAGTDYDLSLGDGATLTSEGNGVYSFVWPQAVKGVKKVNVTRKSAATGTLKFYTLDPGKQVNTNDLTTLVNNKTSEYEVDGLSHDLAFNASTFAITDSKMRVSFR